MSGGRFFLVAASLAALAAVALLGLAADQARDLGRMSELAQISDKKAINELRLMLEKQSEMDQKEAKLFAEIQAANEASAKHGQTAVLHAVKATQAEAAKPVAKAGLATAVPVGAMSLRQESGSGGHESKVDKLKAELAAAEKEEAAHKKKAAAERKEEAAARQKKVGVHHAAQAKLAKGKHAPVTADDFKELKGNTAVHEDRSIATKAGMKGLGFMGSKNEVDKKLRALHCDPTSFVCSGTPAQKKEAVKLILQIQKSITHDAASVKAYGWKEEHALPPAPHM